MKLNVLLADDHALVRAGIRMLLEAMPEVNVLGEAADGAAVIAMVEQLQPNLVLMDIAMPGLNGLEAPHASPSSGPPFACWCSPCTKTNNTCARP